MKLRIKGDSLRLRISPSEMNRLVTTGRIEDAVHFGAAPDARLTYALETVTTGEQSLDAGEQTASQISIRHTPTEVVVLMSKVEIDAWASGSEVGLYGRVNAGERQLEIAVEKDFACLDGEENQNQDTFPNPKQGSAC